MTEFRLGRSIAQLVPFIKYRQQKEDPIITNKMLYIFGIVAIVKIAVLLLWI